MFRNVGCFFYRFSGVRVFICEGRIININLGIVRIRVGVEEAVVI